MFCSFDDIFKPSAERMQHYVDMANADIQRSLDFHGEKCINCAHFRCDSVQGYTVNERCDKTKWPINSPTRTVCSDYTFMGFLENNLKKSIDNAEEK